MSLSINIRIRIVLFMVTFESPIVILFLVEKSLGRISCLLVCLLACMSTGSKKHFFKKHQNLDSRVERWSDGLGEEECPPRSKEHFQDKKNSFQKSLKISIFI